MGAQPDGFHAALATECACVLDQSGRNKHHLQLLPGLRLVKCNINSPGTPGPKFQQTDADARWNSSLQLERSQAMASTKSLDRNFKDSLNRLTGVRALRAGHEDPMILIAARASVRFVGSFSSPASLHQGHSGVSFSVNHVEIHHGLMHMAANLN